MSWWIWILIILGIIAVLAIGFILACALIARSAGYMIGRAIEEGFGEYCKTMLWNR